MFHRLIDLPRAAVRTTARGIDSNVLHHHRIKRRETNWPPRVILSAAKDLAGALHASRVVANPYGTPERRRWIQSRKGAHRAERPQGSPLHFTTVHHG